MVLCSKYFLRLFNVCFSSSVVLASLSVFSGIFYVVCGFVFWFLHNGCHCILFLPSSHTRGFRTKRRIHESTKAKTKKGHEKGNEKNSIYWGWGELQKMVTHPLRHYYHFASYVSDSLQVERCHRLPLLICRRLECAKCPFRNRQEMRCS